MALHSLREEYKINFDEEMDSTLNLLRYNWYSDDDIEKTKKMAWLKAISSLDFIFTYDWIVFPKDIFPVIWTRSIKKVIHGFLKRNLLSKNDFDLKEDVSLIVELEEILEKIMWKKLNKVQVENYLALLHKSYIELKK
jgi:hypothetical protein